MSNTKAAKINAEYLKIKNAVNMWNRKKSCDEKKEALLFLLLKNICLHVLRA